jgi:ABC-type uncharacterized transport system YnjBCD substrate-binding protein
MANINNFLTSVPSGQVTTLWTAPTNGNCTSFCVSVATGSSYSLLVQVPGLHQANEWFPVMPGQTITFRYLDKDIAAVYAQGGYDAATLTNLGAATLVTFGPVAKTNKV